MDTSNMVAHELESYGMCTFSTKEMAFNILGLMYPLSLSTQVKPIWADLNGGMDRLTCLADTTTHICLSIVCTVEVLNQSGITSITDSYELHKHMYPSDIRTSLGSGMGGTKSLEKMFLDHRKEKDVRNDIL